MPPLIMSIGQESLRHYLAFIAALDVAERISPPRDTLSRRRTITSTRWHKALFAGAWLYMQTTARKIERAHRLRFILTPK